MVKTITNYFSPVAKPVEKPFSPPRSNNIMSYFSRTAPSSKEKTSSPEQAKENCQTSQPAEKLTGPVAAVKQPSQKRGRKAIKAARKLVAETVSPTADDSCLIVEEQHESKESGAEVTRSCGVTGSDTAALLAQLSAEASVTAETSEKSPTVVVDVEQADKDEHHEEGTRCESNGKPKSIPSSAAVPVKDKDKQVKTASRNSRKRSQQEAKQPESEPEEKETVTSLRDVSMEVNVDEASQLNNSTVTISFEDFVRSQSQDKDDEDMNDEERSEEESKITVGAEEMDTDRLENVAPGEPSLQVSPRTVTIQAEVHVVSPKQEPVKAVGKVASIFNKRKGATSPAGAVAAPPQTEAGLQQVKRKSNVVLQEEDLELAVLESESTPKCTAAEKKQFMAAFKQASLDGSKTKPGKSQAKQKQPEEKNLDAADKVTEEDGAIPPSVEQVPAASEENNGTKKKPVRKSRKKAKEENLAATTSPAAAPAEETLPTTVHADDKTEEPSTPAVRRSRREAVVRQATEITQESPVRRTRKQNKSKDAAAALPETPVKMSTPKIRRHKHGVFTAEIVSPPGKEEPSPIR